MAPQRCVEFPLSLLAKWKTLSGSEAIEGGGNLFFVLRKLCHFDLARLENVLLALRLRSFIGHGSCSLDSYSTEFCVRSLSVI